MTHCDRNRREQWERVRDLKKFDIAGELNRISYFMLRSRHRGYAYLIELRIYVS